MKKIIVFISCFLLSGFTFGLPLPQADSFKIKDIADQNILYIAHSKDKGHFSNSLIKLVQYYLLNESDDYEVVFPQFSMESRLIDGSYFAIGFKGSPQPTSHIKTMQLKGGIFASFIYKGTYKTVDSAIRSTFKKILNTGKYIPDSKSEVRLLYWNSIDDNYPKDLVTEILVRVKMLP